jgi:DNA mismatch repair ATPase MutS
MWVTEGTPTNGQTALLLGAHRLQGKRLLRLWFLRPVINLEVVDDRQNTVELFLQQPDLVDALRAELKKVCAYGRP